MAFHEIPVVGGRVRGAQRPRAPSLNERPDGGARRVFVLGQGGEKNMEELGDGFGDGDLDGDEYAEGYRDEGKEREGKKL